MTVRVLINGRAVELKLKRAGDGWILEQNGVIREPSIIQVERDVYHVLLEGRSYEVRMATNPRGDQVDVDGREYIVGVEDPRDAPPSRGAAGFEGRQTIAAPMPGRIVRLLVGEGDLVERDQGIVVIEAMKMQNEMKSPKAGRIASISVHEGSTVAAGEVLVVVE
jgi:biotin carboxyl carrier protein